MVHLKTNRLRSEGILVTQKKTKTIGNRQCKAHTHTLHTHTNICKYIYIYTCFLLYISPKGSINFSFEWLARFDSATTESPGLPSDRCWPRRCRHDALCCVAGDATAFRGHVALRKYLGLWLGADAWRKHRFKPWLFQLMIAGNLACINSLAGW